MLDSERTCWGFKSQCCHLADYVTSLDKMWTPCLPLPGEGMGATRLILAQRHTKWCPDNPWGLMELYKNTKKIFINALTYKSTFTVIYSLPFGSVRRRLPSYRNGESIDVEGKTSELITVEVGMLAGRAKTNREWCFLFSAKEFVLRLLWAKWWLAAAIAASSTYPSNICVASCNSWLTISNRLDSSASNRQENSSEDSVTCMTACQSSRNLETRYFFRSSYNGYLMHIINFNLYNEEDRVATFLM